MRDGGGLRLNEKQDALTKRELMHLLLKMMVHAPNPMDRQFAAGELRKLVAKA
jgi:hypothetical protein